MSYSTGYGARDAAPSSQQGMAPADAGHGYPPQNGADPLAEEARFMGAYDGADDSEYATGGAGGGAFRSIVHGAGALGSIVLMVWVGVWGYGQVMRDVTGVPVVQALEGPMRERPEQPGGQISEHKGLAVNAVKAGAPEQNLADTVRLAPSSVPLAQEDVPTPALAPQPREAAAETAAPSAVPSVVPGAVPPAEAPAANAPEPARPLANATPLIEASLTAPAGAAPRDAAPAPSAPEAAPVSDADALARALNAELAPLIGGTTAEADPSAATGPEDEAGAAPAVASGPVPQTEPGVARSPRPASRPDRAAASDGTQDAATYASASATIDLPNPDADLAPVEAGTRLVQLGAFDSVDEARAAWTEITGRFAPLMEDKSRVVQQAEAGGRSFWRLRVQGFTDLSDARRFCSALVAERTDCIPVVAR
ncbi:MAG: SPOR domain-containing protein [Pseudomonadota bacterium]